MTPKRVSPWKERPSLIQSVYLYECVLTGCTHIILRTYFPQFQYNQLTNDFAPKFPLQSVWNSQLILPQKQCQVNSQELILYLAGLNYNTDYCIIQQGLIIILIILVLDPRNKGHSEQNSVLKSLKLANSDIGSLPLPSPQSLLCIRLTHTSCVVIHLRRHPRYT